MSAVWNMIARFASRPAVTAWLIDRASRTPYLHITGPDGSVYMKRYWLFNPYPAESDGARAWWHFPIGIRLHKILREDDDRHLHDHPWHASTIILRGVYVEKRLAAPTLAEPNWDHDVTELIARIAGDTATLHFGEYHRIVHVGYDGVWTLFITGRKRGTWGFLVDGVKVQWRKYLGMEPK